VNSDKKRPSITREAGHRWRPNHPTVLQPTATPWQDDNLARILCAESAVGYNCTGFRALIDAEAMIAILSRRSDRSHNAVAGVRCDIG
jgi:hypothetical protein